MDNLVTLKNGIGSKPVYRRLFQKRDGRELFLYGYTPHTEAALQEDDFEIAKGGELRWHPLRRELNIYAGHRQNRTIDPSADNDPLAPSVPNGPVTEIPFTDFELAVFENKFTSLHAEAPKPSQWAGDRAKPALGRCDVIVYGPEATGNLYSIGQAKRLLLVEAWIDRYQTLFDQGCKYIMPFENRGAAAGVTLGHPHGQIYAFPFIPRVQQDALISFDEGYDLSGYIQSCETEFAVGSAGGIVAFCPSYARFPYEVWLTPRTRKAGPWEFTEEEKEGFAYFLGDITRRYDDLFQARMDYMLSLHAAPLGHDKNWHFTAQFYPLLRSAGRVKYLASIEQSTGTFTVDVMPESSAKILRAL